ncbi:MAG: GT4 family glycosyltransferase PelF [bacterium]|nr:GT4 family glycosyltransferase PelF [bacterium]
MEEEVSVLLTTEGTYPFHPGGVSTWCDNLIKGCKAVSFTLFAIMMNPYVSRKYSLPKNVREIIHLPLWGSEEPTEYLKKIPFSKIYYKKKKTTESAINKKFAPLFRTFLRNLHRSEEEAYSIGTTLYKLHLYFKEYDINETFRSETVWEIFKKEMLRFAEKDKTYEEEPPSLYSLTECLRWLYRFFLILNVPVPKTDVTHSTAAAFCSIPCIISKFSYDTPFLLTEHGIYMKEQHLFISRLEHISYSKGFLLDLISGISRISYYFADQISPVCEYNKRWEFINRVPEERIKTIYNGVDPRVFYPAEKKEGEKTVVVSATRVDPIKDIETLIKGASLVNKEMGDVKFLIYGEVSNPEYYERCIKLREELGLTENVIFAGYTSEPTTIYNKGDIVALTSISEAFPYTVVEAMASGKPIVATDVGGVREALEGCGLMVRAKKPEEFATAIIKLLKDKELRETFGLDARTKVLNMFTVENMVKEYQQSYFNLVDLSKSKREK